MDAFRLVFSIVLFFFLPGLLLVQALYPSRREIDRADDLLFRLFLTPILSVLINGSLLLMLAAIPPDSEGQGYVRSPFIEISILSVSAILFTVGYWRGAYPFLGRRAPPAAEDVLSIEDRVLFDEFEARKRVIERVLERLRSHYSESPSEDVERRIKTIESVLWRLERNLEMLEKPLEVRVLLEEGEILSTRWARLMMKEDAATGARKEKIAKRRSIVERRLDEVFREVRDLQSRQG